MDTLYNTAQCQPYNLQAMLMSETVGD